MALEALVNSARRAERRCLAALALALLCAPLAAQEQTPRQLALQSLANQLTKIDEQIAVAVAEAQPDAARLTALRANARELEIRFAGLATGLDVQVLEAPEPKQYDLQAELTRLLQPIVSALSSATEGPRQLQALEAHLRDVEDRLARAERVARGLERARDEASAAPSPDAELRKRFDASIARWNRIVVDLRDERIVTAGRVDALQAARAPLADSVQNAVAGFFQQRGVSLLLAVAASFGVVLGLRLLQRGVVRVVGRGRTNLSVRLLEVVFHVLVGLCAAAAVLAVFWLRGDFELLAIAIVFLLGLGWALSRTLPMFMDQLRLLLNTGSVREGERLIVDGLPYRVDTLRFYSRLVNPDLQGGMLRRSLRSLLGQVSRPSAAGEPWFPTRTGDFVQLADGTFGRVELQTPEQVVLAFEQVRKTYRTAEFLEQRPSNLSDGFPVVSRLGLDYSHQQKATAEIPTRLEAGLRQQLAGVEGGQHLLRVLVQFADAAASALEVEARVVFGGAAAANYGVLKRAVARILVETCTQHGWSIALPQLTVHRAP